MTDDGILRAIAAERARWAEHKDDALPADDDGQDEETE